jgi:hypothetical protein
MLVLEYRRIILNKANGGRIMNAQSLIGKKNKLSMDRTITPLDALQAAISRMVGGVVRVAKVRLGRLSFTKLVQYQLGETVFHGSFGRGQVVAAWPDGRLLVSFSDIGENRLVFPSLLGRELG